jgi:hypothetical protein
MDMSSVIRGFKNAASAASLARAVGVRAVVDALKEVPIDDPQAEVAAAKIRLARTRTAQDLPTATAAAGIPMRPSLGRALLLGAIEDWDWLSPALSEEVGGDWKLESNYDDRVYATIVSHAARALAALAPTVGEPDARHDVAGADAAAATALGGLASTLRAVGAVRAALNCSGAAFNLLQGGDPNVRCAAIDRVIELAIVADEPDTVSSLRLQRAIALSEIGDKTVSGRFRRFQAFEACLRHLPDDPGARTAIVEPLRHLAQADPALRALRPNFVALAGSLGDPSADKILRLIRTPNWDADVRLDEVRTVGLNAIRAEHARLADAGAPEEVNAEASWATFAFTIPAMDGAIPHRSSFRDEADVHQLVLLIAHEITHVITMYGQLGASMTALRTALLQRELELWGTILGNLGGRSGLMIDSLAPLQEADVVSLAKAEQALDLTLKLQAIESTWRAWLEGVALYGESAARTAAGAEVQTPIDLVLGQLVDLSDDDAPPLGPDRDSPAFLAFVKAHFDAGEVLHVAAIADHARHRLRNLLEQYPQRYLAGYLAVRAVVSSWRRSEFASGDATFRLLLHLTRHGTADVVPDPALPIREFRAEAIRRMLAWVVAAGRIGSEELHDFEEKPLAPARWDNGHLVFYDESREDQQDVQRALMQRQVSAALRSLVGQDADPDRVTGATDDEREVLQRAAAALGSQTDTWAEDTDVAVEVSAAIPILPIARGDFLFWLHAPSDALFVLMRTRLGVVSDELHGHELKIVRLSPESFAELQRAVSLRQTSRIEVNRVADLVSISGMVPERPPGRQLFVYRYGDWSHVEWATDSPAAAPINESLRDAIEARLTRGTLIDYQMRLIHDGRPGAERTLRWIDGVGPSWSAMNPPVGAWVAHLRDMAASVLTDDGDRADDVSRELLRRTMGEVVASRLGVDGFAALRQHQPVWIGRMLSVLEASSRGPVSDSFLDEHASIVEEIVGPMFRKSLGGWDVAPIG